jgi:hypothetical protein
VLQVAVVGAAIVPFIAPLWASEGRQALQARGATADTSVAERLLTLMPVSGRLAYTPQVEDRIAERGLLRDGLGVNALAYRGVSLVNGSFKGISTDALWPDDRLFYGRVRLPRQVVESDAALDVLSVRYLLAGQGETLAPGLRERGDVTTPGGAKLLLYENPDPWPGAFVIDDPAHGVPALRVLPDCVNDRLFCRDLAGLAALRSPTRAAVTRQSGQIDVAIDRGPAGRLLVVAEMFRPEWVATSDDRVLAIGSIGPGLLGVTLPPDATVVHLRYRSGPLAIASVLSWCAVAATLAALLISARAGRPRRSS